jgi:hypothetical protein
VALFALLGPVVGAMTFVVVSTVSMLASWQGAGPSLVSVVGGVLLVAVVALGFGFVLGVVPAAITGAICLAVSRRVASTVLWLGLSALIGGGVTALFAVVLRGVILQNRVAGVGGQIDSAMSIAGVAMSSGLAAVGALAALACAGLSRNWRPRPG